MIKLNHNLRTGILYVVGTPIGNLKDITLRALETLKTVDLIACEDTRVTGRLLFHHQIKTPMISYHQHSSREKIERIIGDLENGKDIALTTDSGTPGISDPGSALVKAAINAKIKVAAIPGPSALAAALSVSGLDSKNIVFVGFLPKKKGRQTKIKEIFELLKKGYSVAIYESPFRVKKTIQEINLLPDKLEIRLFRELTKKFEETILFKTPVSQEQIEKIRAKGEFTIIIKN